MKVTCCGSSDVGRQRDHNEDSYYVPGHGDAPIFALVADGMGGRMGGEVASAACRDTAVERMRDGARNGFKGTGLLELAVAQANWVVYDTAQRFVRFRGMGTTLVLALAQEAQWFIAHVGDSRAYLWRDGQLYQMTTDHTMVQEMVKAGYLTEQQAAVHPRRHVITRAIGVADSVKVDIQVIPALPGDCLLLCSDGLADSMSTDDIADILEVEQEPRRALHHLIDTANRKDGSDNITVVLMLAEGGEADG